MLFIFDAIPSQIIWFCLITLRTADFYVHQDPRSMLNSRERFWRNSKLEYTFPLLYLERKVLILRCDKEWDSTLLKIFYKKKINFWISEKEFEMQMSPAQPHNERAFS
jgi:hypothetical protein